MISFLSPMEPSSIVYRTIDIKPKSYQTHVIGFINLIGNYFWISYTAMHIKNRRWVLSSISSTVQLHLGVNQMGQIYQPKHDSDDGKTCCRK